MSLFPAVAEVSLTKLGFGGTSCSQRKLKEKLFRVISGDCRYCSLGYVDDWRLAMPAEQRKAPEAKVEPSKVSPLDRLGSPEPVGGTIADRLAGLSSRRRRDLHVDGGRLRR